MPVIFCKNEKWSVCPREYLPNLHAKKVMVCESVGVGHTKNLHSLTDCVNETSGVFSLDFTVQELY